MELHIIKDRNEPLLKRRAVSIKINNKGTPSRIDVKNKLAALANSKAELIVIESIDTAFGKTELIGSASIYESDERLKQLAHKHLTVRDAPKPREGEAASAPPIAAPVAAAPVAAKEPEKK